MEKKLLRTLIEGNRDGKETDPNVMGIGQTTRLHVNLQFLKMLRTFKWDGVIV